MDKIRNADRQKSVRGYSLTVVDPDFVEEIVKIGSQQKENMERWKRKVSIETRI